MQKEIEKIVHIGILLDRKLDNMILRIIIEVLSRTVDKIFKSSSFTVLRMEELDDVTKIVVTLEMIEEPYAQRGRK